MNRRHILSGTSLLLAAPASIAIADRLDEAAMQKAIQDYYSVYYRDRDKDNTDLSWHPITYWWRTARSWTLPPTSPSCRRWETSTIELIRLISKMVGLRMR